MFKGFQPHRGTPRPRPHAQVAHEHLMKAFQEFAAINLGASLDDDLDAFAAWVGRWASKSEPGTARSGTAVRARHAAAGQ